MSREKWSEKNIPDLTGKVIIVTGSTSGIGKATVKAILKKNATVIMAIRNMVKGQKVKEEIEGLINTGELILEELELSSLQSIHNFTHRFRAAYNRLDCLINNAGIMMHPYSKSEDGFEIQMGTNHLGHFSLTGLLLPIINATPNARIVNVSSAGHILGRIKLDDINWDTRDYNTRRAYCDSKLANIYFTYELSRRLRKKSSNTVVATCHPGWTATGLQSHLPFLLVLNNYFSQEPEMGCLPTLRAAFGEDTESCDYFGPDNILRTKGHPIKQKSSKVSYDTHVAESLFDISETMTGIKYDCID